jgi:hypothetical protein
MILAHKPTDKLTGLITSAMAKNEEREKGAIATTRLYEDSEKDRIPEIRTTVGYNQGVNHRKY